MAKIERVEILMVVLAPKVKRIDAIQAFVSQETPIVRITDSDGMVGSGYRYSRLPLHLEAGGARSSVPLYNTERISGG